MTTTPQVFIRHNTPTGTLQSPYDGPYEVISRGEKTFKLRIRGKPIRISVDRFKPAYILEDDTINKNQLDDNHKKEARIILLDKKEAKKVTKSGRPTRPPVRFSAA